MPKLKLLVLLALATGFQLTNAQVSARMFQQPDISETHIVFNYAENLWVVPKTGGQAVQLSSPKGSEMFPKFSPDGNQIAFTGNYAGNNNIFVIDAKGGLPKAITSHGGLDRVVDWHPNGEQVLFASGRESGRQRFSQFYLASAKKGLAEKLPLEHAEYGSYSPDAKEIAFTDKSRLHRTWKRYRGGTAADIWIYNFESMEAENITNNDANDELPMYHGSDIYYLSDQGKAKRFNIWKYSKSTKESTQVTKFKDFDIHFPSIGPKDLVFEAGGKLYLMDLTSENYNEVKVKVSTDFTKLIPQVKNVSKYLRSGYIAPDGKRVAVEARGEVFSLPAEEGVIKNLTQTSGVYERYPTWSPNGKYIAYWSDASGEYQLVLRNMKDNSESVITEFKDGFRYETMWSPDSKKVAFIDQTMQIYVLDIASKKLQEVDRGLWMMHGALSNFTASWSPDSRWITYSRGVGNQNNAIFIYDTKEETRKQITSGYYSDSNPTFGAEGKYLFFATNRHFAPSYSNMDNTWIYDKSTQLAAIPLTMDIASPLAAKNDTTAIKEEKKEVKKKDKKDDDKEKKKKDEKTDKDDKKKDEDKDATKIDLESMEQRIVILPTKPGSYRNLAAVKGKLIYTQRVNNVTSIMYYDIKDKKDKKIIDANGYMVSADGKKMLVTNKGSWAVVNISAGAKMDKKVPTSQVEASIVPKDEWKQIFKEVWRIERDYFYDKKMHGLNWDNMFAQYSPLIDMCVTRSDVNYVIGELIGEMNASHSYRGGGELEYAPSRNVGYLGIDWEILNGQYRIKHIVKGAKWDAEAVSPLAATGLDVEVGDYIFSVNGIKLDTDKGPYTALSGLAGKTVELMIGKVADPTKAKSVIVKTMKSETRLRHLQWIESNRSHVADQTDNKVGYIYVRSTGIDGQNELVRQFYAQWDKEALIIDERFNSGGQIPDRFIELLNRKPLAYFATRDGKDWPIPAAAHYGPKVMLINGWSGSGGDAFPDYFRKAGLGELIGSRTWGGLIGISGAPNLIDNGMVTAPTFRMFSPENGDWFPEGHGVDPDIEVVEDPGLLSKGIDPQLDKAIEVIKQKMKDAPYVKPSHEKYEKR